MDKVRIHNHLYSIIELAKDSKEEDNADNIKRNALCILHDITLIISEIEGKDMYGRILPQPTSEGEPT